MGSGVSGLNKTLYGTSQPYAASYAVVPEMLRHDKRVSDIYDPDKGYFKNPTATDLKEAHKDGEIRFKDGKPVKDFAIYVLDNEGHLIIGYRKNPNNPDKRSPHPTLIGGKDPHVACAGILHFKEGKIISVDQERGHFRPHEKSLRKVGKYLKDLCREHPELFHEESPWRKGK